jgi:uncharacterized protein
MTSSPKSSAVFPAMHHRFETGPVYVGRVALGQDIIQTIEAFCQENHITAGWVTCMGAVQKTTLAYYDQKDHQYHHKVFSGEFEIVSGSGNISLRMGSPMVHLHMVLSDTEFTCVAGHVIPGGTEVFACEFMIQTLSGEAALTRQPDADTGLPLWS